MVEQYNLQKQLDAVQSQQKQILQLQQHQQQSQQSQQYQHQQPLLGLQYLAVLNSSHSRSPSLNGAGHRRTGSSGLNMQGHARRHSLGLNEAIKAAASQKVSNLASYTGQGESSPVSGGTAMSHVSSSSSSTSPPVTAHGETGSNLGGFRFPNNAPNDSDLDSNLGHSRSKSLAYGQQQFKFPPDNNMGSGPLALQPPTPSFGITSSPERGNSNQRRSVHLRTNSRNMDGNINSNWRAQQQPSSQRNLLPSNTLEPPQAFVPGHRHKSSSYGGGNSLISSMLHFLPGNGSGPANANGRKSLFAPYLPQSSLPDLINEGRLVTGTLRVNKKNRSDAYVSTDGLLDADIFICGLKDRNRALEGDLVAVELLVVDEVWESKKEKEEKKRRKGNPNTKSTSGFALNDDIHNDATSTLNNDDSKSEADTDGLGRRGSLKQRPTMKKNDDVEVEGQALLLVEEEEINDDVKPLYAGHVVAVVDRIPGQIFAGTLGLLRPAQAAQAAIDKKSGKELSVHTPKSPKIVWFKPTDKRVPLIAVPTEQAPKDFVDNHEKYADQLFIALIKRWPITSLHPFGTLVTKLGKINDPEVEIDSILRDNNFLCDEYPPDEKTDDYVASLLSTVGDVNAELQNPARAEYSSDYIVALTENGSFSDSALHVKRLSNTKIELGFHSADISFFVQPSSALERKAKKRSSSVFLPQKTSDLYPNQLVRLVSFKENEKNLAVSVILDIDTTSFEVENVRFLETVITPKSTISYDDIDAILKGEVVDSISSASSDYIKTFALIAKEFRRHRLSNRGLGIQPTLALLDQIDDEKVRLHMNVFHESSALLVVSEIAHKVNSAIATKIHAVLGDEAFLRRQPLPTLSKLEGFARKAAKLGFHIDTSTSGSLQSSILSINNTVHRRCIETLLYKSMPRAKYFIAGKQDPDNYGHFYLNSPLYTHFSSSLRRFADLVVHRQLKSVLRGTASPETAQDLDSLKTVADYCNFKKDCAANAQEQAIHLLLCQTINELSEHAGQMLVMGTVVQVYESSFDVFIPEFGIEKRVHGDQLPLVRAEFDKNNHVLELYWEKGVDSATYVPPDEKSQLSYRLSIKNKHRTSAAEAAKLQQQSLLHEEQGGPPTSIVEKFERMNIGVPEVAKPRGDEGLQSYLHSAITRVEGNNYLQEIRELHEVAVVLRAEIGLALPCLTVRVLNPFA